MSSDLVPSMMFSSGSVSGMVRGDKGLLSKCGRATTRIFCRKCSLLQGRFNSGKRGFDGAGKGSERKAGRVCNVAREEYAEKRKFKDSKAPDRGFRKDDPSSSKPLAEETVAGDVVRRYWLEEVTGSVSIEEMSFRGPEEDRKGNCIEPEKRSKPVAKLMGVALPQVVADFILPAGYPDTVSGDYLRYMLWQFPTNVTGWICSTLVTSSLFKAVGVGVPGGFAAAATATIKWVSKDGLGALGLILIGGRFGGIFDEDPKQWRLYADFIGSAGSIFELYTPVAPDQFLLLGSLGYLFKAVAKGLKAPSFRVIQNHFAISENVGDLSAKEEVWEVSAKLVGLGIAVFLLGLPGLNDSYWKLLSIWITVRSFHLWLRYQSLAGVQLRTINYKRASILVKSYLHGSKPPGYQECNGLENLLVWWQLMSPRIRVGCSLKDILGASRSAEEIEELLTVYCKENYVLVLHPSASQGMEARVLAKEGATNISILRCLWQAHWLLLPNVAESRSVTKSNLSTGLSVEPETFADVPVLPERVVQLSRSLQAMDYHFDTFLQELEDAGWDLEKNILKFPTDAPTLLAPN